MTILSPSRVASLHIANQKRSVVNEISPRRYCRGPRCNSGAGMWRSIQQFKNKAGEAVFKYCKQCRGHAR